MNSRDSSKFSVNEDGPHRTISKEMEENRKKHPLEGSSADLAIPSSSSDSKGEERKILKVSPRRKILAKRKIAAGAPAHVSVVPNPIEELSCSQEMKDFLMVEYGREKSLYSHISKTQIANAVIHRFKTYLVNSGKGLGKERNIKKDSTRRRKLMSPVIFKSHDVSEFGDVNMKPPEAGSFSLSASAQLGSKLLLVRFISDSESHSMTSIKENQDLKGPNNNSRAGKVGPGLKSKKKSGRRERNVDRIEPRKVRKIDWPICCLEVDSGAPATAINSLPEFLPNVSDEIVQEEAVGHDLLNSVARSSSLSGSITDEQFDIIVKAMEEIHQTPDISLENEDVVTDNENNVTCRTPEKEENETPETSPTLVESIRRQSESGLYRQRRMKEMSLIRERVILSKSEQAESTRPTPVKGRITPRNLFNVRAVEEPDRQASSPQV